MIFLINNILLGVGLAMDAFSVSLVDGLNEPKMRRRKHFLIAFTFAFFQFIMPLLGYFLVHIAASAFKAFSKAIPFIGFILLSIIGTKMLIEGIREIRSKGDEKLIQEEDEIKRLGEKALLVQGIATSIDALSVGFTIASYDAFMAFEASLIIAAATFLICMAGLVFGKKFGEKLSEKASILGGLILIIIGLKILFGF
jgi:putative Mn2+ efflux pump MntP